jgi:iron complex outermembrane recepter protein
MRTSYLIMLACSSSLATIATPLFGQDMSTATNAAQATPATPPSSNLPGGNKSARATAGAQPSPDKATNLSQVVVTATKRAESIQSVPVPVTVVTQTQLQNQGLNDIQDLAHAVPGLTAQGGPTPSFQIRGIGVPQNARTAESSVGIVLDGVALDSNATAGPPQLFDVARIEVLEGPQGTLFGRSTSAGVINITSNAPDPSKTEVIVHADQGSRDSGTRTAVLNLPTSTYSALRLSLANTKEPKTVDNDYLHTWDNTFTDSFRARYLWQPTENLTFNLIGDFTRYSQTGGGLWSVYQSTPGSRLSQLLGVCGIVPTQDNNHVCQDAPNEEHAKSDGVSAQVDYDFGNVTLTSISALRHLRTWGPGDDADSVPINILNVNQGNSDLRNESQEFRLSSSDNNFFDYVAGLYYFHSTQIYQTLQEGEPLLPLPFVLGQASLTNATETSYAGYGEATLKFTPTFRGIIGLRYGNDDISANTMRSLAPGALFPFTGIASINGSTDHDYSSFRLGVQDDLASNIMSYVTFTKGYKGPAINDQATTNDVPVIIKPEIPLSWEAGLKTTWFNGQLGVDGSIYHTRYENYQSLLFDPTSATFVYGNAPSVTIKGVELSAFGRLTPNLTLNFGVLYNDGRYGKGYFVSCAPNQTAAEGCQSVTNASGVTTSTADAEGNPLISAPKVKATLNATYTHALNADLDGFISGDAVYTSRIYFDPAYDPDDSTGSHLILGTKFGVRSHDGRWGVYLYVRNLTNEFVPQYRFVTPSGAILGDKNTYSQTVGADSFRTVGVSFDLRF